jgi:hypothetical protein
MKFLICFFLLFTITLAAQYGSRYDDGWRVNSYESVDDDYEDNSIESHSESPSTSFTKSYTYNDEHKTINLNCNCDGKRSNKHNSDLGKILRGISGGNGGQGGSSYGKGNAGIGGSGGGVLVVSCLC